MQYRASRHHILVGVHLDTASCSPTTDQQRTAVFQSVARAPVLVLQCLPHPPTYVMPFFLPITALILLGSPCNNLFCPSTTFLAVYRQLKWVKYHSLLGRLEFNVARIITNTEPHSRI